MLQQVRLREATTEMCVGLGVCGAWLRVCVRDGGVGLSIWSLGGKRLGVLDWGYQTIVWLEY